MPNPCASFGSGLGGYGGGFPGLGGGASGLLGGGLGAYGGSLGGLGGFGGGLGGLGGGLGGPICGVPIGFGMTTTVGGLNPYTDDIYATGPGYGASLGYGATGVAPVGVGGLPGGFSRGLNRGPYSRPY